MRKNLFSLLLVLAVIIGFVTPAYAASERSLTLWNIEMVSGKGVVFTFIAHGKFKESELKGSTTINYQDFPLSCNFNDEGKVKCLADRGLGRFIGQIATGQVAGFAFSGRVMAGTEGLCYNIFQKVNGIWHDIGSVCGDVPAHEGDWILVGSDLAIFHENGPAGAGFYIGLGSAGSGTGAPFGHKQPKSAADFSLNLPPSALRGSLKWRWIP